jgi:hypothetical protein
LAGRAVGFYYETLSDVISDFKADPGSGGGRGRGDIHSAVCTVQKPVIFMPSRSCLRANIRSFAEKIYAKRNPTACFVSGVERIKVKEASQLLLEGYLSILSSRLFFSPGER